MLVGEAAVRPDVCPQTTAGATVRLVCTLSSPLPGQDSLWSGMAPVWATCTRQVCGSASMGSGVLAGVDLQGARGWEGQTQLTFAFGGPLWEGPCRTRREADLLERWIHKSTALGVCAVQASSVTGTGSLWDFGWGMGEAAGTGQCLCSPLS